MTTGLLIELASITKQFPQLLQDCLDEEYGVLCESILECLDEHMTAKQIGRLQQLTTRYHSRYETRILHNYWLNEDKHFFTALVTKLSIHIRQSDDYTLSTRLIKMLTKWLQTIRDLFLIVGSLRFIDSDIRQRLAQDIGSIILPKEWVVNRLYQKFQTSLRRNVCDDVKAMDDHNSSLVSYLQEADFFWASEDKPTQEIKEMIGSMERDFKERTSPRIFAHVRVIQLISSHAACHRMVCDGTLKRLWEMKPPSISCHWEGAWITMIAKAVKHGWLTGQPLHDEVKALLPRILNHLSRFGIHIPAFSPRKTQPTLSDEIVHGDYNHLWASPSSSKKAIAQILVYSLLPTAVFGNEEGGRMWEILQSIIQMIEPCSNPGVSLGKLEKPIANFAKLVVVSYLKRVGRERHRMCVKTAGRFPDGSSYRLGRIEDRIIIDLMLPIALEGMLKRDESSGEYETVLATVCSLDPSYTIPIVTEKVVPFFDSVTEPFSMLVALKVLARMGRFVVTYSPTTLLKIFTLAHKKIDIPEPIKSLTFISSYLAMTTFMAVGEVVDDPIVSETPVDWYGFDFESLQKIFTPLYGYKTRENKELFDEFFSKTPAFSIQNYPDERLDDQINPKGYGTTAPDVRERPGFYAAHDLGNQDPYQTPQGIMQILNARAEVLASIPSWADTGLDNLLQTIDSLSDGSNLIEGTFAYACRSLVYILYHEATSDRVRRALKRFLKWATEKSRPHAEAIADSVLGGLITNSRVDGLKIVLDEVSSILIDSKTGCLNPNVSRQLYTWLVELLSGAVSSCDISLVVANIGPLSSLYKKLLYHRSPSVYNVVLDINYSSRLLETSGEYDDNIKIFNAQEILLNWNVPLWMKIRSTCSYELGVPSCRFVLPDSNKLDLALLLILHTDIEYFIRLWNQYTEIYGDNLRFDPFELYNDIESTIEDKTLLEGIELGSSDPSPDCLFADGYDDDINVKSDIIFKMIKLIYQTFRKLSYISPDEKNSRHPKQRKYILFDRGIGDIILKHAKKFIFAISETFVGLRLASSTLKPIWGVPAVENVDLDRVRLTKELLSLAERALIRGARKQVRDKDVDGWKTFSLWTNPLSQIHPSILYESSGLDTYVELCSHDFWRILDDDRSWLKCTETRRELLHFIIAHGYGLYAEVRADAQKKLGAVIARHIGVRTNLVEFLVTEFQEVSTEVARSVKPAAESTGMLCGLAESLAESGGPPPALGSSADEPADNEAVELARRISREVAQVVEGSRNMDGDSRSDADTNTVRIHEAREEIDDSSEPSIRSASHAHELLTHSQETGLIFMLGDHPNLKRVLSDHVWKERIFQSLFSRMKSSIESVTLRSRYVLLARGMIEHRCFSNQVIDSKPFISQLIDDVMLPSVHWRARVIGLAVIAAHLHPRFFENDPKILKKVIALLVAASDRRQHSPLLTTLATASLTIVLKLILKDQVPATPESYEDLLEAGVLEGFLKNLPTMHAQIARGNVKADMVYAVVVDIIRVNRSWPSTQSIKLSKNFASHCAMFAQTYTQFLMRKGGPDKALQLIGNVVVGTLSEWSEHATSDLEIHCGACECLAGVVRAARKWTPAQMLELFRLLAPPTATMFARYTMDLIANIGEASRWAVNGLLTGTKATFRPRPFGIQTNIFPHPRPFVLGVFNLFVHAQAEIEKAIPLPVPKVTDNAAALIEEPEEPSVPGAKVTDLDDAAVSKEDPESEKTKALTSTSTSDRKRLLVAAYLVRETRQLVPEIRVCLMDCLFSPECLSHPYKKLRDDIGEAIMSELKSAYRLHDAYYDVGGPDHDLTKSALLSVERFKGIVRERLSELMKVIEEDYRVYSEVGRSANRSPSINEIRVIMGALYDLPVHVCDEKMFEFHQEVLPLAFEMIQHPDDNLMKIGWFFVLYLYGSQMLPLLPNVSSRLVDTLTDLDFRSLTLSKKKGVIQTVELYVLKQRGGFLYDRDHPKILARLGEVLVTGLNDSNNSVTEAAARALAYLTATLTHAERARWAQRFFETAGAVRDLDKNSNKQQTFGAIMGLSALLESATTNEIPYWLPPVITKFAKFANRKASDRIRAAIEKRLRAFLNHYQKDWETEHQYKFTREQLDTLNTFKGRPIYFA